MSKYLILKFRNAKLFRSHRKTKDYSFDLKGQVQRITMSQFVEPITTYQISNVLHVLFNERPVPSMRTCLYPKIDYYFDKANESFIRLDGFKRHNKSKGIDEYIKETVMVKKAVWNSWNPNPIINWEIVKRYIGNELYPEFEILLLELVPNAYSLTFLEVRNILNLSNLVDLSEWLSKNMLKGLYNYILDEKQASQLSRKFNETGLTVNSGVDNVIILNGEIIVPIDDNDINKLRNSKGSATILDGGFLWIDSIQDGSSLSNDGFTKMSEISTEKFIL